MLIHVDESGDLGWKFDKPYRQGGSSRYLTIASLCVDRSKKHIPKRVIREMYTKFRWSPGVERKWSDMDPSERSWFAKKAAEIEEEYRGLVKYISITVRKENVQKHIRRDANKLYNYMIGLSLLKEMSLHDDVHLFPDARGIKVGSGNSLHDYLQTKLWFDKGATTDLKTTPCDSSANRNIQFADMISGVVQGHFEDGNSQPWELLRSQISYKTLFF